MISPGKFRRLAEQTVRHAAQMKDGRSKQELLQKAELRLRAATTLERMGFRDNPAGSGKRPSRIQRRKLLVQRVAP